MAAGSMTTSLKNSLIDLIFRNGSWARPANWDVALFTVAPSDAGGGTEVSGGAYARQSVATGASAAWGAPTDGDTDNDNTITFPTATANWGLVVAVALFNSTTMEWWGWLSNIHWPVNGADTGDVFTAIGHTLANDDRVIFQTQGSGVLPTGISEDTLYWVVGVSGDTFQVSLTQGGAAIALTADGAGTVHKVEPKQIDNNDVFRFNAGDLDIQLY